MTARAAPSLITPMLVGGSVILMLGFAIRAAFGVFQIPIATEFGWPRTEFSLAIAVQSLAWGIGQPFFAAIGERFGTRTAVILGALVYAAGLVLSAQSTTPGAHQLWNVLIGCGVAGTGFGVILGVVGRAAAPEQRSLTLGIATAAGSAGQVIGPPAAAYLLGLTDWQGVFLIFAGVIIASLVLLPLLRDPPAPAPAGRHESLGAALSQAARDPSFTLIFLGFFSCGYQLSFVTAHFPAFVTEACAAIDPGGMLASLGVTSTSQLGAWAIGLIGFANIGGTILAGKLGGIYPKKSLLALIYAARTAIAAWFILVPMTPVTVVVFSLSMGSLWLATVPLTSGLIGTIYGLRYMGTLYGIVFFSHQLGGFLGIWMGGKFYDLYGSYTLVWWVGVGVGAFSALVHLPIRERPGALQMA